MKRCGLRTLIGLAAISILWLIGNLLLEVQLPQQQGRYVQESPESSAYVNTLREVFETLPTDGKENSRLNLIEDNTTAWVARWRLLAGSRENLDISYFILKQDIFGVAFLGHVLHKAREGLQIRILLDAIGTKMSRDISGNDYLDTLVNSERVTVKMYRPLFFRYLDLFLTLNPAAVIASNHDKILLSDGKLALIGGRNISKEYFSDPKDEEKAFYDTDILFSGPRIGAAVKAAFEAEFAGEQSRNVSRESVDIMDASEDLLLAYEAMDAWLRGKPVPLKTAAEIRRKNLPWIEDLKKLPHLRGALRKTLTGKIMSEMRLLDSRTRLLKADDPISSGLARMARSSRHEIFIQSPYLVLSKDAITVFEKASARGVRITVLTNSPVSSDNTLSQAFFLEQWPELMARVPTLRLYVAGDKHNLHSKIGAIDNQLALVGTYNLDPVSMAINSEIVAVIWSKQFSKRLLQKPRGLIAAGPPNVYEYRIARDKSGRPERDRDGRVVVGFGPMHHSSPDQWNSVQTYSKILRGFQKLPGAKTLY